jgi:hypothetical protein
MVKHMLVLVLLTATIIPARAQMIEASGSPTAKEGVITLDSTFSKDFLYGKCLEWFAIAFKNSKAVLQMQDKESGIIIGKALFTTKVKGNFFVPEVKETVSYIVKIMVKSGKVKYEISNFETTGFFGVLKDGPITTNTPVNKKLLQKQYDELRADAIREAEILSQSLIIMVSKKDTW